MKKANIGARSMEDTQLYRLFAVFGVAILGFALLRLINESRLMAFLVVGRWVCLGLLLLNIAGLVYFYGYRKLRDDEHVFTFAGISYFTISAFLLLTIYEDLNNANVKVQVAFAFIALFAVIYNIFKREFVHVSALFFAEAMFLYFISAPAYSTLEKILRVVSDIAGFAVPVLVLAGAILALKNPDGKLKIGGRTLYRFSEKFETVLLAVTGALLLVASLVVVIASAACTAVLIALLILYIIIGMVCTIKLI